jgi:hypothetical protein
LQQFLVSDVKVSIRAIQKSANHKCNNNSVWLK